MMSEAAGHPAAGTGLWCRHCGTAPLARAVHEGTGREACADGGHVAAPIDFLTAAAS